MKEKMVRVDNSKHERLQAVAFYDRTTMAGIVDGLLEKYLTKWEKANEKITRSPEQA